MESVLLVDDEKDNLEALRRLLRQDFAVTTTESGVEALKLVRTKEFAVVVSDQRMPEIKGVDLLEKMKHIAPHTTRILLTGYTDLASVVEAINRGNIYRYIAKPWDPEDLRLTLRQGVEAYRLRKSIEEKNAQLETANAELKGALDRLRGLDAAKARFLSLVSHELNTPLTAVRAFVELLDESKKALPADVQRAVVSLGGASDRLAEIVDEVLSYVRLETEDEWKKGGFVWDKEIVSVLESLESARAAKQVEIAVQGKAGVKSICAPQAVRAAVKGLVAEALRHCKKGERLEVLFKKEGTETTFRVTWKGEALPVSALAALEMTGDIRNHHRNLGLGLATAKRIAERHGGTLVTEKPTKDSAALTMRLPE